MSNYKEMYLTLARAQRDAILILQEGQQKAEELFLSSETPDYLRVLRYDTSDDDTDGLDKDL